MIELEKYLQKLANKSVEKDDLIFMRECLDKTSPEWAYETGCEDGETLLARQLLQIYFNKSY